jgi:hypothetical protein
MTEPTRDNAQIRNDQQAFMAAYERAKQAFGRIPGVLGVGFGHKQTGGQFSDDVCLIVFVGNKRVDADLDPAERIPPSFEGYRTDVRTPVRTVPGACDNDTEYSTIQGGIQIEADPGQSGTLGCIVRRRGDRGRENVYLLSNKHVLWAGSARDGSYVYHPHAPPAPPSKASNSLGPVQEGEAYRVVTSTVPDATGQPVSDSFFIDCATARINIDCKCCGSTCTKDDIAYGETVIDLQVNGVNTISDVRSVARDVSIVIPTGTPAGPTGPFVYKVGRTTGRTRGIVRSINATLHTVGDPSVPGAPPMVGPNVIEIDFDPTSTSNGVNCHGNPFFAEHGDSGSLVVDDAGRAIGLIQGVPDPSIPGSASAAACHILPVLDHLGICIPTTTGTSHGSSRATDGSGLAAVAVGEVESGDPAISFAGGSAATAPSPVLMPVSDAERDHMFELRDRFRATPQGPELHELFARVRREVGYLVRNCRPVKVAWHRGEGPAFLAHTLNHLRGESASVPAEVAGVTREQLLTRMADVLTAHGSIPLREAIERHRDELLPILCSAGTAEEAIERLAALGQPAPAGAEEAR